MLDAGGVVVGVAVDTAVAAPAAATVELGFMMRLPASSLCVSHVCVIFALVSICVTFWYIFRYKHTRRRALHTRATAEVVFPYIAHESTSLAHCDLFFDVITIYKRAHFDCG